ncbi:hypothetical protein ACOSP7_024811 [Xanthoceras sorbifolium]
MAIVRSFSAFSSLLYFCSIILFFGWLLMQVLVCCNTAIYLIFQWKMEKEKGKGEKLAILEMAKMLIFCFEKKKKPKSYEISIPTGKRRRPRKRKVNNKYTQIDWWVHRIEE